MHREDEREMKKESLDLFQRICQEELGIIPEREFYFHPTRKWRADYMFSGCWPRPRVSTHWSKDHAILVEIEGGVYTKGRHVRGKGYENDIEKYNAATLLGYRVFRFTPRMIKSGYAMETLKEALK